MEILKLLLFAVGFSMDACAVSICKGLAMKKASLKECAICGIWFGGFQALMPLIGFLLGSLFAQAIDAIDHWIALVLLCFIGLNMLKEAFSKSEECEECSGADLSFQTMLVMAIATSIDALAGGITLAIDANANVVLAITLIGVTTFAMSCIGVKVGNIFGSRYEKKAQAAGGIILILLGIIILLQHLEVLG